jgi:hypothetical protein
MTLVAPEKDIIVIAFAAQHITAKVAEHCIVPCTCANDIVAFAGIDPVIAAATFDCIVAAKAEQFIIVGATEYLVTILAACDRVFASTAPQRIKTTIPVDRIIPEKTLDEIRARRAFKFVIFGRSIDLVLVCAIIIVIATEKRNKQGTARKQQKEKTNIHQCVLSQNQKT